MKNKGENIVASVRQRLINLSKENGEDPNLVFIRYAIERLLYRLSCSKQANKFVLKGAMLFQLWGDQQDGDGAERAQQLRPTHLARPTLVPICWARQTAPNRRQEGESAVQENLGLLDICWAHAGGISSAEEKDSRPIVASPLLLRG